MNVVFRVDASTEIGTGHLIRCLTLAEVLIRKNIKVKFITREQFGNLAFLIRQRNIEVVCLPPPVRWCVDSTIAIESPYERWLGMSQSEDAQQTIDAIGTELPDWLVVDHYAIDASWEALMRPFVRKIFVIDDLANRTHDCDVLLDQNYYLNPLSRYQDLLFRPTCALLGPNYALLNEVYVHEKRHQTPRQGVVKRVLVYFGGSDPHGLCVLAVEALSVPKLVHLEVDLVVGANYGDDATLSSLARARGGVTIRRGCPNLAQLIAGADLAIGAGGTTTWERMCLGLPSIVVTVAENQRPGIYSLHTAGLIYYAGHYNEVTCASLSDAILLRCNNPSELIANSLANKLIVDGLGVYRVSEIIYPSDLEKIQFRPAGKEDVVQYFKWANDPIVRANSRNSTAITWDSHQSWFFNKLESKTSWLFVMQIDDIPFGQIRFDQLENMLLIDYSLDASVRGRGLGRYLIEMGSNAMSRINPIKLRAEVKIHNMASVNVFRKLKFNEQVSNSEPYLIFTKNPKEFVID